MGGLCAFSDLCIRDEVSGEDVHRPPFPLDTCHTNLQHAQVLEPLRRQKSKAMLMFANTD